MKTFKEIVEAMEPKGQTLPKEKCEVTISKAAMASAEKVKVLMQKGMGSVEAIDAVINPMKNGVKTPMFATPRGAAKHKAEIMTYLKLQ